MVSEDSRSGMIAMFSAQDVMTQRAKRRYHRRKKEQHLLGLQKVGSSHTFVSAAELAIGIAFRSIVESTVQTIRDELVSCVSDVLLRQQLFPSTLSITMASPHSTSSYLFQQHWRIDLNLNSARIRGIVSIPEEADRELQWQADFALVTHPKVEIQRERNGSTVTKILFELSTRHPEEINVTERGLEIRTRIRVEGEVTEALLLETMSFIGLSILTSNLKIDSGIITFDVDTPRSLDRQERSLQITNPNLAIRLRDRYLSQRFDQRAPYIYQDDSSLRSYHDRFGDQPLRQIHLEIQSWRIRNGLAHIQLPGFNGSPDLEFDILCSVFNVHRMSHELTYLHLNLSPDANQWTVVEGQLKRREDPRIAIRGYVMMEERSSSLDYPQYQIILKVYPASYSQVSEDEFQFEVVVPEGFGRRSVPDRRPAFCNGCSFYHEPAYRGDSIICAVHPSGYQGESTSCPDWAS
jgi:hypothetical protein